MSDTHIRLVIPADRAFVTLARSVAAHLGARIGLSAEDVDDFRLAVDEACCLFLSDGRCEGGTLLCDFAESPEFAASAVTVTVSASVDGDFAGRQVGTFGWSLLQSLVDGLWWSADRGRADVCLLKRRPARRMTASV